MADALRFILVHGAFQGAWCWERVIPELERRGHSAVAVDLPGHGTRVKERATTTSYTQAVVELIEPGDVLVGQAEVGGWTVSMAADLVPANVARLIYLAASSPIEGKSMLETAPVNVSDIDLRAYLQTIETEHNGACLQFDAEAAANFLFNDCTRADQQWACDHLCPQPLEPVSTPVSLSSFWTADIPKSHILCTNDRTNTIEYSNDLLRRQGLRSCAAIDASHSPFISQPETTALMLELCGLGLI